jgi:uncharacterized protein YdaU (DUF1376 family)
MVDWYPWYPVLFRADTPHLNEVEEGVYRRLIDWHMETRRPLPDDDRALAGIARVSAERWARYAPVIRAFFHSRSGKSHQFEGKVIRLTPADHASWRQAYGAIPDLDAELTRIDDALEEDRRAGKSVTGWFAATSAKLAAKHQKFLAEQKAAANGQPKPAAPLKGGKVVQLKRASEEL